MSWRVAVIVLALSSFGFAAEEKELHISLHWKYQKLPNGVMKVYELDTGTRHRLWETGSSGNLTATPAGSEIPEGKFVLYPGSKKTFVLVMHNTTKQPLHFFAAPHHVNPPTASLGFKFKCLCVNHAFKVPSGAFWYRVVQLQLSGKYRGGENLTIMHDLIGIDAAQMRDFAMPSVEHAHED